MKSRTTRSVEAVVLILALASACKRSDAPAPAKTPLPPAQSPDAGAVKITATGADTLTVRVEGPRCRPWFGGVDVLARRDKSASSPHWQLTATPAYTFAPNSPREEKRPADLRLSIGKNNYVWDPKSTTGTVSFSANGVTFDAPMTLYNATDKIRVVGKVTCATAAAPADIAPLVALLQSVSGLPVRRFSTFEFGRSKDPRAISVVLPRTKAAGLVRKLRTKLGNGWSAWQGTSRFVDEKSGYGVEVVVGPARRPADILRIAHVDPVNYGLSTQHVVEKLKAWDEAYGVDVVQADVESIHLRLKRTPKDVKALAADVYAFCPDIVDQGAGTVAELERAIAETQEIQLWWD